MKRLIFICGASGIGKSTICNKLYRKMNNSAFVDSDYCRMIYPFEFSDELKAIVEDNMATMLVNYLKCSSIENTIFLYGFHGPRKQIFDNIMTRLADTGIPYTFIPIVLECELNENIRRARNDGRDESRVKFGIINSRDIYNQYDYLRLDITHLTADEAADKLINMINHNSWKMKKLICFGDSITAREISDNGTERLTPRLRNALNDWDIINAGVSGNNSRDALVRLNNDVLKHSPDLVTVLFGANDAASHKMIELKEYESNLLFIVEKIGADKTILISPSPVDETKPRNRTNNIIKKYADLVQSVARSTGSQFIDLFSEMIQIPDYENMLSDGLHYNESGYEFLANLILQKITEC